MSDRPPISELSSWKEIANYLQVSVRTAQLWEKQRGLPVRRVPGGRGRVYLRLEDLEDWLEEQRDPTEDAESRSGPETRSRRLRIAAGLMVTAFATLSVAALWGGLDWVLPGREAGIDSLRIDNGSVVGVGPAGEQVWRVPLAERLDPHLYENEPHLLRQEDIDGDGAAEVLVPIVPEDPAARNALLCLEPNGSERWRFEIGARLRTRALELEPTFRVRNFGIARLRSGARGLVVVSTHSLNYPTQVVLLDPSDGRVLSEYWHPGHLGMHRPLFLIDDLDGDGADEVYLAGISNARELATLVVLDPAEMSGAARENHPDYRFEGIRPANERVRIFFPKSLVSREHGERYNIANGILRGPDLLHIAVDEAHLSEWGALLHYGFDLDLTPRQVSLSDTYLPLFDELRQAGIHDRSEAEERRWLLERVEIVRDGGAIEADGR